MAIQDLIDNLELDFFVLLDLRKLNMLNTTMVDGWALDWIQDLSSESDRSLTVFKPADF